MEATEATAEAEDAFGNCTIPQVSLILSVVEFQVWRYRDSLVSKKEDFENPKVSNQDFSTISIPN